MDKTLNTLAETDPSEHLLREVLLCVHAEDHRIVMRRRAWVFGTVFVCSVVGFVPLTKLFLTSLSQTGFVEIFSLLLTDPSIVLANWRDATYSLLEALPTLEMLGMSSLIWMMMTTASAARSSMKEHQPNRSLPKFLTN